MYYHVILYPTHTLHTSGTIILNLQREKLEERVLLPHRRGTYITHNGASLKSTKINRVRILATEHEIDEEYLIPSRISGEPFTAYKADELDAICLAYSKEDVTNEFITGPPGWESEAASDAIQKTSSPTNAREVFVVHGRNEAAREALFAFLHSIDLRPLEWPEIVRSTEKPAPYIGQALDAAFAGAHAVVVFMTPDDEARLSDAFKNDSDPQYEAELTGQARANVLFEAGMAMGRNEEQTILVELGDLRPFSDIGGRHVIRLDDSPKQRQALAQRLADAGCAVNLQGDSWHTAGNFMAALEPAQSSLESVANTRHQPPSPALSELSSDKSGAAGNSPTENSKAEIIPLYWSTGGAEVGLNIKNYGKGFATEIMGERVLPNGVVHAWKFPALGPGEQIALHDHKAEKIDPQTDAVPDIPLIRGQYLARAGWTDPDGTKRWGNWLKIMKRSVH